MRLLLICFGGACGTAARYGMQTLAVRFFGDTFPYGTLSVNLIGSFLMSIVIALAGEGMLSETARLALMTGILGGFTTYSSFNAETLRYLNEGAAWKASVYLVVTLAGCLLLGQAGVVVGRLVK